MESLFVYQKDGSDFLARRNFALLGDEMGLGKSAQAIDACNQIKAKRILVICPAIARTNWLREFEKFSQIKYKFKVIFNKHPDIVPLSTESVIMSYDLATYYDPKEFGNFDVMICDEAHYLKSIKTKRTKKILGNGGWVRHCKARWFLTGTPAPNNASELWPLLYTSGYTKDVYNDFVAKYCDSIVTSFGTQIVGTKVSAIPELRMILNKIMLRRQTKDVLKDLPPLFYQSMPLDCGGDDFDDSILMEFENNPRFTREKNLLMEVFGQIPESSEKAFMALEGLAGSISTVRRYLGLRMVVPISTLVHQELEDKTYSKIVLFCIHTQVVEEIENRLKSLGHKVVVITGETSQNDRQNAIDSFQNDKTVEIFIGNIQAAGTAITLTSSHQCVFVEQDWVPGNNAQAAKRLHRIGQTSPVFIRVASIANSFGERISAVLMRKTKELAQIFDVQ